MFIPADTVDDLLRKALQRVLNSKTMVRATKGENREIFGVLLELKNPRARLSGTETKGKLFSCMGEFLWYVSGSNSLEFISYYINAYSKYSDDKETLSGAYGPRIFKAQGQAIQFDTIISLLKRKQSTRQAVIQLFDARDIQYKSKDVPCTCTLQFVVRKERLHMLTTMRSNDVLVGMPHDIFAFTMLQEFLARILGLELGTYKHAIGSLHLYEDDLLKATSYIQEGWQATSNVMPTMPFGDPRNQIKILLEHEKDIRLGKYNRNYPGLKDYWADFVKLLLLFRMKKDNAEISEINNIKSSLSSQFYQSYIDRMSEKMKVNKSAPETDLLGGIL